MRVQRCGRQQVNRTKWTSTRERGGRPTDRRTYKMMMSCRCAQPLKPYPSTPGPLRRRSVVANLFHRRSAALKTHHLGSSVFRRYRGISVCSHYALKSKNLTYVVGPHLAACEIFIFYSNFLMVRWKADGWWPMTWTNTTNMNFRVDGETFSCRHIGYM